MVCITGRESSAASIASKWKIIYQSENNFLIFHLIDRLKQPTQDPN